MKLSAESGLTAIESIMLGLILVALSALLWTQHAQVEAQHKDSQRKQDINTISAYLDEAYYPLHRGYPPTLSQAGLKGLPLSALQDPEGRTVGDQNSDLQYAPTGCQNDVCTNFTLSATLQKEAQFVKVNETHPQ